MSHTLLHDKVLQEEKLQARLMDVMPSKTSSFVDEKNPAELIAVWKNARSPKSKASSMHFRNEASAKREKRNEKYLAFKLKSLSNTFSKS